MAPDFEAQSFAIDLECAKSMIDAMAARLSELKLQGLSLQICQHIFRVGSSNLIQYNNCSERAPTAGHC